MKEHEKHFFLFTFSFFLFTCVHLFSQNKEKLELMPGGNIFPNLKADFIEARTGLLYYPSTGYFKIDAGDAVDILRYSPSSSSSQFSFGSEFFVHALGLNVKSKRLPIDAADGYFGMYFSYSNISNNLKARLRILHNSAHLVDGHLERNSTYNSSVDYTRDFAELTIMKSCKHASCLFEYYTGAAFSIVIHPKELNRFTAHGGVQISFDQIINNLFGKPVNLFFAYHFNLTTIPAYVGNDHFVSGLRFGEWEGNALTLFLSYYIGTNLFNQYYNERVKEFSIGFYIE